MIIQGDTDLKKVRLSDVKETLAHNLTPLVSFVFIWIIFSFYFLPVGFVVGVVLVELVEGGWLRGFVSGCLGIGYGYTSCVGWFFETLDKTKVILFISVLVAGIYAFYNHDSLDDEE